MLELNYLWLGNDWGNAGLEGRALTGTYYGICGVCGNWGTWGTSGTYAIYGGWGLEVSRYEGTVELFGLVWVLLLTAAYLKVTLTGEGLVPLTWYVL